MGSVPTENSRDETGQEPQRDREDLLEEIAHRTGRLPRTLEALRRGIPDCILNFGQCGHEPHDRAPSREHSVTQPSVIGAPRGRIEDVGQSATDIAAEPGANDLYEVLEGRTVPEHGEAEGGTGGASDLTVVVCVGHGLILFSVVA